MPSLSGRASSVGGLALAMLVALLPSATRAETEWDGGLFASPDFAPGDTGKPLGHWSTGQHALGGSYEFTSADGVLTIRRTGREPWGMVSQDFPADAYVGKRLRLSMEIATELDDSWGEPIEPSGLVVRVTGYGLMDSPMMGARILVAETAALELDGPDWQELSMEFDVPESRHVELRAGVQLTSGGVLRARKPRLEVIQD